MHTINFIEDLAPYKIQEIKMSLKFIEYQDCLIYDFCFDETKDSANNFVVLKMYKMRNNNSKAIIVISQEINGEWVMSSKLFFTSDIETAKEGLNNLRRHFALDIYPILLEKIRHCGALYWVSDQYRYGTATSIFGMANEFKEFSEVTKLIDQLTELRDLYLKEERRHYDEVEKRKSIAFDIDHPNYELSDGELEELLGFGDDD